MQPSYTLEKATELAGQALSYIDELAIPPTPEVFEVWFIYCAGSNADITRAIDILKSSGQAITAEQCAELHERFLSESNQGEKVRQAGDQINNTIKDMSGMVQDAKTATTNYNKSLESAKQKISKGQSSEELRAVLDGIMSDTDDVLNRNKKLEEELAKSSQMMQDLQKDLEAVRKEALTDSLTGLANRKSFDSEITRLVVDGAEDDVTFSLIMMDIDHFKAFNDNYGHQVGDQVLRLVALTLVEGIKGRDLACRYGGEEFALLLPDTTMKQALHVGDFLRKAVAGKDIVNRASGEKLGKITMSGGVAEVVPGESVDDLIARADAALYTAKHNGRNQMACAPVPRKPK